MRRALRELVGLYWESGIAADIPALAWYLLASLVPLALGLTALAAVVLGDYAEAQALAARVSDVLPEDVQDQIVALVLRTESDSPLLIAGAIVGMVWTSSGSVGVIDRCLSRMLSIKGPSLLVGNERHRLTADWLPLARALCYRRRPIRDDERGPPPRRAEVAQLVEHRPEEAGVVSSNLTLGTIFDGRIGQTGGSGSVGRASPCQGEGRGFESRLPLHFYARLAMTC